MLLTAQDKSIKTVRFGDKGEAVGKLQQLLNQVMNLVPPLAVNGDFGKPTEDAVIKFQSNYNLADDGIVGKNTWTALFSARQAVPVNAISTPQAAIVPIAVQYLGAAETENNRMGNDTRMKEIFEADNLAPNGQTDGYAWCAAFVSLCLQKLVAGNTVYAGVKPPREASVSRFLNQWAKDQKCLIFSANDKTFQPAKGDIVVFTFSHIGIVEEVNGGSINTIEGNTNKAGSREGTEVLRKQRKLAIVRQFIRLPVSLADESGMNLSGMIQFA